ncbi:MAG TPA: tetratricopeptide repeat protein [Rhodothermales bacterium]|nr:tetratricopeptide repeat protein [Rhodothermales bacterium]
MLTLRTHSWCVSLALLSFVIVLAGCAANQKEPHLTKTDQLRQTLDPRARQFLIQAQQAYKVGRYNFALALTDSAEALAYELADVDFLRGQIYTEMNRLDIARAAYETALKKDPEYRGARMNIGVNEFRRGKLQDAIKFFHGEEKIDPNSSLYLEMARAYASLGVADSARIAYEKSIALDSTNATAYMWLGQLYEATGDYDKAVYYSRRGLQLKPEDLDYHYILGSQLYRMGEVDEAAKELKLVADKRPWHQAAQYNMGQVLIRQGKEKEAQVYLDQADKAQQLQQKTNEAEEFVNRNPKDLEGWVKLGELFRQAGTLDRAIDAFKVAASIAPWNLNLQSNLASLILANGNQQEAVRRYSAILRADSTLSDVWLNLGVAYADMGRLEQARQCLRASLRHNPRDRTARNYLAQLDKKASMAGG